MADTIDTILDIEQDMFVNVKSSGYARCQEKCKENAYSFRLVRKASFETWSDETLKLYHADVQDAALKGINLMTIKYARMSDQIPKQYNDLMKDLDIDKIVKIETDWLSDFSSKQDGVVRKNDGYGMRYLRGELETYSSETVGSYLQDRLEAKNQGINLVEKTYENIFNYFDLKMDKE